MDIINTTISPQEGIDILEINGATEIKVEEETCDIKEEESTCDEVKADEEEAHINSNNVEKSFTLIKKSKSENIELDNKNEKAVNGSLELNYKEDQWSPNNPSGKKYYDCDFLYSLRDSPIAQKKPDNVEKFELVAADLTQRVTRVVPTTPSSTTARLLDGENGNFKQSFIPAYARGPPRSGTPSRRSQHGKQSLKGNQGPSGSTRQDERRGGGANSKSNVIQITLNRDVKLNESENAWKPTRQKKDEPVEVDTEKTRIEEIYKKFRSILNKITPQNFKKLINQVREFKIDNEEILEGVINLVFEKAVDEPSFAEIYALMCKDLEQIKVKRAISEDQSVSFRYLIIKKCQTEFQRDKDEERLSRTKSKEIEECTDPEEKKALQLQWEEKDRKSRMRSLGNVKFIGELFKQQYINSNIMIICITGLLTKIEEETMESLCKLLTTIGKSLEITHQVNLQQYINQLKTIGNEKSNKLTSRIRFMIRDVIELRMNNWVPRQILATPKKLDEINLEAENERMKNSFSKYPSTSSSQRDDRVYSGRTGGSRSVNEESGWSSVPSGRRAKTTYIVDSDKLRTINTDRISDVSLGPPTSSMWSRGSASGKRDAAAPSTPKPNPSLNNRGNRTPVATKTFNSYTLLDETYTEPSSDSSKKPPLAEKVSDKPTPKQESPKQFSFDSLIEDFKKCSGDPYSELLDAILYGPAKDEANLVKMLITWALQINKSKIITVIGRVTGTLVYKQHLTCDRFLEQFKEALEASTAILEKDETIWDLLSKFVWSHNNHNELTFSQLHATCSTIITLDKGYEFLMSLFCEKVEDSNEVHLVKRLWEASNNMRLTDWMSEEKAKEFLKCMDLDFLQFGDKEKALPEEICSQLQDMMQNRTSGVTVANVKQWIETNVGEGVKELWFIRALTEAVYMYTLCSPSHKPRFDADKLKHYYELFIDYICDPKLELECLFTIQDLMNKLEHPSGIAPRIFENLWETEIISSETFNTWKVDQNMQVGKGVMLKSLNNFFQILEYDGDSEDDDQDQSTVE